jgi:tetratricopeptide (TPR) repeat protein
MKYLAFSLLLAILAATGCAQTADRADPSGATEPADADYHVLMAEIALQRHQFATAASEYYQALSGNEDAELAARAGRVIYEHGTYEQALDAAWHWTKLDPDAVEPRRYLALLYLQVGAVRKSLPHLEFLHGIVEESSEQGFAALLPVLTESRDEEAALEAMRRLVKDNKDDPTARYALGYLALQAGELELALSESRLAMEGRPGWPEAAVLHARALLANGHREQGLALLEGREDFREDGRLRLEYAILLLAAQRPEEARLELELLLAEYPRLPGALRTMGFLEFQAGNYELAERYFIDLIGTGLYVPDALFYLGNIAEIEGDLDSAVSFYSQVKSGGNLIQARVRLSLILYRLGKSDEALRSLENVVAADPDSSIDLASARGELLMRMGRFDDALELYTRELERYPDDRGLLFARSFLYERMDRVDEAIVELRALLAQDPDDPVALNALGYTLADRTDQFEEAYELIRRAYEQSPDNAAIVDSMGWVEFRMGNHEQAIEHLRRAWALQRDPEIAAHLGEVLWTTGDRPAAEEIWFESLSENPESEVLQEVIERLMQ